MRNDSVVLTLERFGKRVVVTLDHQTEYGAIETADQISDGVLNHGGFSFKVGGATERIDERQ